MDDFLWVQKYRPRKISDCILPDRLKTVFQSYVDSGTIPNLMLTGKPGVGKTTVARALCEEVGLEYMFLNSSRDRGIDTLRTKISGYASTLSLSGKRKVIILDEADYITPEAQAALRGSIEEFSKNCTFIFTVNFKAKLIEALHSRCAVIDFSWTSEEKPKMASQFFMRTGEILTQENVKYDKNVLIEVIKKFFPDFRRTLNELQRLSRNNSAIDVGILAQINDIQNINELVTFLKEKNFSGMRKWVASNSDVDPSTIVRRIYDGMYTYIKPDSIPLTVMVLSKYQYRSAFVVDQELNTVAMLTELMVESEFK